MNKPIVAIVGRPNVGKSQLFNRLVGKRVSIIQDEPGITRDRIYSDCSWRGKEFLLVDTGGLDPEFEDPIKILAQEQSNKAIKEASLLLFVVDAKEGLHCLDKDIAILLKKTNKPVILLINKIDDPEKMNEIYEFQPLGMHEIFPISALHGLNIGELLDSVLQHIKGAGDAPREKPPRISIAGRRNVGKSSLINALAGDERSIVHETAGTTRDCVDSEILIKGKRFIITDTSGLRRKGKIDEKVEYYSAVRTIKTISDSDCVLLVLNAEEGIVFQDKRVAEQIQQANKASVIILNKWDIIKEHYTGDALKLKNDEFKNLIRKELYFIDYSPILVISAKKKTGISKIQDKVEEVLEQYWKKIDTSLVNRIFQEAQSFRPAPSYKGEQLRIYYAFQENVGPPRFTLKVNSPKLVHFSYKRYLENTLRKALGFTGTPVILNFKKK